MSLVTKSVRGFSVEKFCVFHTSPSHFVAALRMIRKRNGFVRFCPGNERIVIDEIISASGSQVRRIPPGPLPITFVPVLQHVQRLKPQVNT